MHSLKSSSTKINCTIQLPFSKSESNRALIIQHLCSEQIELLNISNSDDTRVLQQLLRSTEYTLNSGAGGTTFRFLLALFALKGEDKILTGDDRFNQRPVKTLVDALNNLGANISYLTTENFAPLKITKGDFLKSSSIQIDASVSSQFISALLLIAPCLPNGLKLELTGEVVSMPYILMTLKMMQHFGIEYEFENNSIRIQNQNYQTKQLSISADWSAASYIYQMAVLAERAEIFLPELKKNSFQGDEIIADLMQKFGVETEYKTNGILIRKTSPPLITSFSFNFINHPDLAMTMAFTCAALGIEAELSGLNNLSVKETDRIAAIKNEIEKLGTKVEADENKIHIYSNKNPVVARKVFSNYNDHRMIMSVAPLAILFDEICLDDIAAVSKSFPGYFLELAKTGLQLEKFKK